MTSAKVDSTADVSKPRLVVDPAEKLFFSATDTGKSPRYIASLKLTNPHDRYVMFKIRTTQPDAYIVKPNNGLINPHEIANVSIILQQSSSDPPKSGSSTPKKPHRFMVQSCFVPPSNTSYNASVWESKSSNEITGVRLSCNFTEKSAPPHLAAESAGDVSLTNFEDADNNGLRERSVALEPKPNGFDHDVQATTPRILRNQQIRFLAKDESDGTYGLVQLILCSLLSFMLGLVVARLLGGSGGTVDADNKRS